VRSPPGPGGRLRLARATARERLCGFTTGLRALRRGDFRLLAMKESGCEGSSPIFGADGRWLQVSRRLEAQFARAQVQH
jgi:hypothetical protein